MTGLRSFLPFCFHQACGCTAQTAVLFTVYRGSCLTIQSFTAVRQQHGTNIDEIPVSTLSCHKASECFSIIWAAKQHAVLSLRAGNVSDLFLSVCDTESLWVLKHNVGALRGDKAVALNDTQSKISPSDVWAVLWITAAVLNYLAFKRKNGLIFTPCAPTLLLYLNVCWYVLPRVKSNWWIMHVFGIYCGIYFVCVLSCFVSFFYSSVSS